MKITSYHPGTPCWIDLGTPEPDQATTFYSALLGWRPEPTTRGAGGYTMFDLGDAKVAAIGPLRDESQPPAWTWYASVPDIDETTGRVRDSGGTVLVPPMDVMDQGRMAVYRDNTGTPFAAWQPRTFPGAGVASEPGAFAWSELQSRDPAAASGFYSSVLGWTSRVAHSDGSPYTEFQVRDSPVAGVMPDSAGQPITGTPGRWLVYFAVTDCDEAVSRITGLGGRVVVPRTQSPAGSFAIATDPAGAPFGVIQLA